MLFKRLAVKTAVVTMTLLIVALCFGCDTQAKEYSDTNHWAKNYIDYATTEGMFLGVSDTMFAPDDYMTRGMFVTVLYRQAGSMAGGVSDVSFADVDDNAYYSVPISWAVTSGVAEGTGENNFSPDDNITREDASVMMYNYQSGVLGEENVAGVKLSYDDKESISDYATKAVYELTQKGVIKGYENNTFEPKKYITRAEAAALFTRYSGHECDVYIPVVEEPKEVLELLGTYKLTCYCSGCNSPRGSRQTSSGALATAGEYGTIAVSPSLYRSLGAGTVLYIEGIGYRKIHDKHGNNSGVIDVYVGEGSCRCAYNAISGTKRNVYIVR